MKQKKIQGLDFSRLRLESGEILGQNANRLTLMLAIMIAVSPLMLYLSVLSVFRVMVFPLFSDAMLLGILAVSSVFLLLTQFITLPLWFGLLEIAKKMESGVSADLTDLFYGFSNSIVYRKALRVSFSVLWRLTLLIATEWGAALLMATAFNGSFLQLLLGIPLYIGIFLLWFLLAVRNFLSPYLAWQSQNDSHRMQPYAASVGNRYFLGFFPWLALSFLTFGILFLADTLPRMLIAYFRLCRKLNEFTTQSEDLIK